MPRRRCNIKTHKNILLVSPKQNWFIKNEIFPSGALILIGTILHNKGDNVKVIHLVSDNIGPLEFRDIVSSFKPDIVGITMSTFQTKSAKEISKIIKEVNSNILVVTGGPHPSALKLKMFDDFPHIDVVVVGEGEHTFLEIVEGKDLSQIKGIAYNHKLNPLRPLVENLDYIPLPKLDLVDLNRFTCTTTKHSVSPPMMFITGSRGCPFHCTFCNKSVWGNTVRFRKPELVIEEIKWLHKRYGIREIFFQDDTFNLNRKWAEEVFYLIINNGLNKGIVYRTPFRVNEKMVDEDLLKLAKEAGFWRIFYGVESGNQEMLDKMRKGTTIEEIKRAFELTHKVGLKTEASFIIGMPSETKETIMDSINLWRELKPEWQGFSPAIPFPDTEFERVVIEKNHLMASNYDEYNPSRFIVRTDSLTKTDLEHYARLISGILSVRAMMKSPWSIFRVIIDGFRNPRSAIRIGKILWTTMIYILVGWCKLMKASIITLTRKHQKRRAIKL